VISQWNDGFQGEVTVRNGSTARTSTWTATYSFGNGQRITQSWNASVTQSGTQVSARNVDWNGALPAGGTASFGFLSSWAGTNTPPTVTCTTS
jgi:cellulase/cellobiase CelA1